MANPNLSVELTAVISGMRKGFRDAITETKKFGKNVDAELSGVDNSIDRFSSNVTGKLAGIFSVGALIGFGKAVVSVTSDFEKYNAVLGNTLSSTALAGIKIREIQEFAAKTPFSVNELTASFVKLANSGFKPTGEQMTKLGDLAASTGKSFDQLSEAILDAQSGEFERLKEFGIRAKDAGDSVIFTYKGVQTQVEKTSGAIRGYITDLGGAVGVSGSMEKISKTLGGQISNLGDNWDSFLLSFGNNTTGVFNKSINGLNTLLNGITRFNREIQIAEKYGLKSDLGQEVNRAINPFAKRGATQQELAVYEINLASKNVADLISKATSGAKSVSDFGKALADLKKQGDLALTAPTVGKKGDAETEKIRAAIKDQYQIGAQAIIDARRNFISDLTKPDGNFGKSAGKDLKTFAEIMAELTIKIKQNNFEFKEGFDARYENINAYTEAIKDLIKNGYEEESKAVQGLIDKQKELTNSTLGVSGRNVLAPIGRDVKASTNTPNPISVIDSITPVLDKFPAYAKLLKEGVEANNMFSASLENIATTALGSGIADAFSAIGEAMANGTNAIDAFGQSIISAFSSFLNQLGQMFIKEGIAQIAYGVAKNLILPGSGVNNISGGAGMIAAGAAISIGGGLLNGGKGKSAKQSNTPVRQIPRFASGVQNFGGGLAMVGERGAELVNLPTGSSVVPNDRTNRILSNNSRNNNVQIFGEVGFNMEQFVIRFRNAEKRLERAGA